MISNRFKQSLSLLLATIVLMTGLVPAGFASTKGRRNTAIGLTSAAVYEAVKGKKGAAVVLGAGAAYAWKRTADSKKQSKYKRTHHKYRAASHHKRYRSKVYASKKHYRYSSGRSVGSSNSKYYKRKAYK